MAQKFKVGDHVSWNSEAGRVRGKIVRVHTKDVNYKGYVHHASKDEPQYEIKSDKTSHIALHKGRACGVSARAVLKHEPEKWKPVSRLREALLMLPPLN
jgi:hypothetical protein